MTDPLRLEKTRASANGKQAALQGAVLVMFLV